MKITVVVASLPPRIDGIGDYTAGLSAQLARTPGVESVEIITGEETPTRIFKVALRTAFSPTRRRSVLAIANALRESAPDWVVLQYNAFSFGRWGLNLYLPLMLRQLRRRMPRLRLAVMVHEPFMPCDSWKMAIMTTWQRWQLWLLGHTADVVFFSIDPWVRRFSHWFPRRRVLHLPVGSNIPRLPLGRTEARTRLAISKETFVMALFGTARDLRMLRWVGAACEAVQATGREVLLLYIGPDPGSICGTVQNVPIRSDGALPPEEVSHRLAAADLYLAPFVDGASTRRTSLMTGLQHGLPVISTLGPLTDDVLAREAGRALLLADVNAKQDWVGAVLRAANCSALREQLGVAGREFYEANFSWPRIGARLLEALLEADERAPRRIASSETSIASE